MSDWVEELADEREDIDEDSLREFADSVRFVGRDESLDWQSLEDQLETYVRLGYDPIDVIGFLEFEGQGFDLPENNLSNKLDQEEALRLYLLRELGSRPDTGIEEILEVDIWRNRLNLSKTVSHKTVSNIADRVDEDFKTEMEVLVDTLARDLEDHHIGDHLRDPPTVTADGVSPPEVTLLSRQLRKTGYSCIRLRRDEDRATFDKWELLKPYELASRDNHTLNDAAKSLESMPAYWHPNRNPPSVKALWNQVREFGRNGFRRMFLTAFEQ